MSVREMQPGKIRVALEGALDRDTVPDARKRLLKIARSKATRYLEMDFSNVSSMDTAGLAVLVEVLIVITPRRGELHLTGLGDHIKRMISMARLDQIFPAETSLNIGN